MWLGVVIDTSPPASTPKRKKKGYLGAMKGEASGRAEKSALGIGPEFDVALNFTVVS